MVDLNPDLITSCSELFQSSSQIFSTLLAKYTILENIAIQNGFNDIVELQDSIYAGKCTLSNANELNSEINKLDDLFVDGQNDMYKGSNIFKELKSSSIYNTSSFDQKSKVLTALVDSKSLFIRAEIRLSVESCFSGK